MSVITISLSEESRLFLEEEAAAEGFDSPIAFLEDLIRQERVRVEDEADATRCLPAMDEAPNP